MPGTFNSIIAEAVKKGGRKVAVAGAEGEAVIRALDMARAKGIATPVLVGNKEKITALADSIQVDISAIEIYDVDGEQAISEKAVELVDTGEASTLMKGKVSTPSLLKAVLNKQFDFRTGRTLSHVSLLELPAYHKGLIITDAGMVITPTLEQKKEIVQNAVIVANNLGIEKPRIAVLAAIEKVNPGMPETEHAAELVKMAGQGEFGNVVLEGPIAMDVALSKEAAAVKGLKSIVSGDPDILLVPNIACGNILAKALIYLAQAKIGGIIAGAKKPVILLSRADNAETKLNSIAFGVVAS